MNPQLAPNPTLQAALQNPLQGAAPNLFNTTNTQASIPLGSAGSGVQYGGLSFPTTDVLNPVDPYAAYGGTSAYNNNLGQFNQGINTVQSALDRSGTQLGVAQSNINNQFNTNQNQLDSSKAQAQQSYDQSGVQNQQALRTNKNTIADQASQGLRGLLRTLGMYGAGGSSEALYNAPQAVATQASAQRAGAGQTFAQNQQGLDTNWNNFVNQDTSSRQKLSDWKTQQLNGAQAQSDTAKQNLLQQLAQLQGQKAAYTGGSYTGAAQPYLDQANQLSGTIDQLGAFNPTYNGVTPTYTAPTLDSYIAQQNTGVTTGQGAAQDNVSPYLTALLGQNKQKINGLGV